LHTIKKFQLICGRPTDRENIVQNSGENIQLLYDAIIEKLHLNIDLHVPYKSKRKLTKKISLYQNAGERKNSTL